MLFKGETYFADIIMWSSLYNRIEHFEKREHLLEHQKYLLLRNIW
jgi:hypothetical protein